MNFQMLYSDGFGRDADAHILGVKEHFRNSTNGTAYRFISVELKGPFNYYKHWYDELNADRTTFFQLTGRLHFDYRYADQLPTYGILDSRSLHFPISFANFMQAAAESARRGENPSCPDLRGPAVHRILALQQSIEALLG